MINKLKYLVYRTFKPKRAKVTAGAIIEKKGKILLEKRKALAEYGKWCLPGGHVNYGETVENAIKRECKEEVNINLEKLKFLFYFDEIIPEIKNHAVVFVFSAQTKDTPIPDNKEVSEIGWFSLKEIEKLNMAFKHKEIIRRWK